MPDVTDLAPTLLIAVPQLHDRHFRRAVVLLVQHDSDGSLGLVLNRPGDMHLSDVAERQGLMAQPALKLMPVYQGGPVEPERGFVLHAHEDLPDSSEVLDGLWISNSTDALRPLLQGSSDGYRLYLGCASWHPGQLEAEIREGSWIVAPATAGEVLFQAAGTAWEEILRKQGYEPAMIGAARGVQ